MALYEIKNYIKLLCIRIDHIESYVVDELNTSDEQKINEFVKMYKHRKGLKILIFEMADEAHVITYEQMQSFIHTLHVFDYIRQTVYSCHCPSAFKVSTISVTQSLSHLAALKNN